MKLFSSRTDKTRRESYQKPGPQVTGEQAVPKNGRLFLAVAGSLFLMIALGAANIRLIGDPSAAMRAFGRTHTLKAREGNPYGPPVLSSGNGEKVCYVPPQVTFYRELSTQDELEQPSPKTIAADSSTAGKGRQSEFAATGSSRDQSPGEGVQQPGSTCAPRSSPRTSGPAALPRANNGEKRYTVQVGAFTQPGIARQWAARWKAKGYHVSLKPVARPSTGVIHRLYLGDFSSARKADELVKRLKSKEGIDAFRLVLRH